MKRKPIILIALLVLSAVAVNAVSYGILAGVRDQAQTACADADRCRQLSAAIAALQTKPTIADTNEQAFDELTKRIEAAAKLQGIAGDNHLASIDPEPASRVADTVYLEKPTTVHLRDVTLPQLLGLVSQLAAEGGGLRIKALRLTAPPQKENGELWSAEISVTYLIYAPLQTNSERAS